MPSAGLCGIIVIVLSIYLWPNGEAEKSKNQNLKENVNKWVHLYQK
jgi:hypothetical protein